MIDLIDHSVFLKLILRLLLKFVTCLRSVSESDGLMLMGAYLISPGVQKRGDIPGVYLVIQTGGHIFAGDSTAPWSA